MAQALDDNALDTIFRTARTHNGWSDKPVGEEAIRALYELLKWGPTSANCSPARFLFLTSQDAKNRLAPHLLGTNVEKTMAAPVCVIIAYDTEFYERLPELFPHAPEAKGWFDSDPEVAQTTAFRNGTLQGAYLLIAARALGLDTGPMSGFDNAGVDKEFFPDGKVKSNFLCNLGYGNGKDMFARSPRLDFDAACRIL